MIKVINVISDTNIGGAGKCVLIFAKNFDRTKLNLKVVLPKDSLLKPEIEKFGVEVFEVDGMADQSMDLKCIPNLVKYFKQEKPQIVHTHASVSARIAARIARVPSVIYTRHCVFPPSPYLTKGIGKVLNGWINHTLSDRIIAVAEAAKDNLVEMGISDKRITVLLNGVEPLQELSIEEKGKIKESYGIHKEDKVVGIVARLEEVKGHEYFIDAAKIVLDKKLPVKFIIAGTGSREGLLKEKVKQLNLEKDVIFAGFVKDVTGLMNILDINANASFGTEATSLSLLEGMSLGKPAVVTNYGGNPGVIKDGRNGFLVPIKEPQAMAEAFLKLLTNDELWNRISQNSKEIFETTFTSQVMTRNIEKVYEELAEGR
jgi:glycosyltransferase involved in cell wall biosynthesis